MNTKKLLKPLLAVALSAVMVTVTACSKDSASSGGNEKDADGNYKDKLKISVAQTTEVKDGVLDNEFHKYWMDKFNVEWDYNYVQWDSWPEKLRLWINSGDLPDVASWNYVHGDFMNYVDQGLLYKFPDDWKERWPNVAAAYKLTGLGDKLEELTGARTFCRKPVYYQNKPSRPAREPNRRHRAAQRLGESRRIRAEGRIHDKRADSLCRADQREGSGQTGLQAGSDVL